jgi:hypothetical protein
VCRRVAWASTVAGGDADKETRRSKSRSSSTSTMKLALILLVLLLVLVLLLDHGQEYLPMPPVFVFACFSGNFTQFTLLL